MSINLVCLTGPVGKLQYRAAGQPTKSGKKLSFPSLSIPIRLADDQVKLSPTQQYVLQNQDLWIDVGVPTHKDDKSADEDKIFGLLEKINNGFGFGLIAGGTITEWGNPVRRQVRVPFSSLSVSAKPLPSLNRVTLMGRVLAEGSNFLQVEERYNVKGDWRSRNIPVLVLGQLERLKGRDVLVYGRLASRSYTGNQEVYVIASPEEIFVV
jgi:hypothetical protein